jgi:tRNA pseudouridine55 synthase
VDGVIVVDKPAGCTSHDVVNRVRRLADTRRVGHLGTLDPLATGVLPLVVGRATRLAQFFTAADKAYDAWIRFGWSTVSYDRDGNPTSDPVEPGFSEAALEDALARFRGTFAMKPPPVSAKKVAGIPAYKLARKQQAVDLAPVDVTVYELRLREFRLPRVRVTIRCSAGTYVRGIAHELGGHFGCGAFLDELRRTASGDFTTEQARTIDELAALADSGHLGQALVPSAQLLPEFPAEFVDTLTAGQIRQGRDFHVSPFRVRPDTRYVKAVSAEGDLVAIGEAKLPHVYHPVLVL